MQSEHVPVEQVDRECAVRIMADRWHRKHREAVLRGEHDDWIPVQEVSRHRLAHTDAAPAASGDAAGEGCYPDDSGLGEQQRPISEAFSGFQMLRDHVAGTPSVPADAVAAGVEDLPDDAAVLAGLACMAGALDKRGLPNAAHYMRTAGAKIARLTADLARVEKERERIVAWLRSIGGPADIAQRAFAATFADAIERGDHLANLTKEQANAVGDAIRNLGGSGE